MRLAALIVCAALLELGWLALWPLSATLSHSTLFSASLRAEHPAIGQVLDTVQRILPVAATSPTPLNDALGSPSYVQPATALAGVLLWLAAVYGLALLLVRRGLGARRSTVLTILVGAGVFQATLMYLPGLFSQDVFSYIAYGRLAAVYQLNPYIWPPSVLRDPVVPWVADVWRAYPAPYGPLWVNVQWLLGRVGAGLSIADQALVYRALANLLLLANLALAWRLLGRLTPLNPTQRTTALAALAWNPPLLFEIAGNAHNDVLMVTLTFAALLLFRPSSRGVRSTAALTLGTLVKYLSGLGLIWLAVASAARVRSWLRRAGRLAALGGVALGVALLLVAPWLELPDSLDPLVRETAGVGYVNSLPDTLALMLIEALGGSVHLARTVERLLIVTVFGVYLIWEARQVWCDPGRTAVARALARSSLTYVLLVSTSVQPWYFCLPVSIAVALGCRRRIARLTLAYSALALPALYLSYYLREATPGWVFLVYAFAPLATLAPEALAAWAGARAQVPAAVSVGDPRPEVRLGRLAEVGRGPADYAQPDAG